MSLLASGTLVSPLRQPRRARRRGKRERENEKRREIPEVDYDVKAYEGMRERETDDGTKKEMKEPRLVSMAPKRRGVYVVSADVSFLLANKASL